MQGMPNLKEEYSGFDFISSCAGCCWSDFVVG